MTSRIFATIAVVTATVGVAVAAPAFTDVTNSAGLNFVHFDPNDPGAQALPQYFQEMTWINGGASAGDYDGDGFVDLFVTRNFAPPILYRNQGDGTFTDVTAATGIGVGDYSSKSASSGSWGDVDNDGDLDLYVTSHYSTQYSLFINDGAGNFTDEAVARGAAISDPANPHYGMSSSLGDYDNDGFLDLHVNEWGYRVEPVTYGRLLHNDGSGNPGHFTDVTAGSGVEPVFTLGAFTSFYGFTSQFADIDSDGYQDIVVASDFGTSEVYWNNHDGTFTPAGGASGFGTDENGMGLAIADYNGDGLQDVFITSIYDDHLPNPPGNWGITGNRLYENNGDRTFTDATDAAGVREGGWGWGTSFFDFDNDGDRDLIMTNGFNLPDSMTNGEEVDFNTDPMRLWRNDGGSFTEISASSGITDTGTGKALVTFDYDNDGDLDVFVMNNEGSPVLYRNDGGNDNDWLRVEAQGVLSNRDGIGALVTVMPDAGGDAMMQQLGSASFLGQSEAFAHFGLGDGVTSVDEVMVSWPSGLTEMYYNVPANGTFLAVEGQGFAIAVPEPSTGLLLVVGAAFWSIRRRRR